MPALIILVYAAAVYLLFLAVLGYAIGFLAGLDVPKGIDEGPRAAAPVAVAIDLLLLLFAIQHTVMARPWFKRRWTLVVPGPAERASFVLAATLVLALLFWLWRPVEGTVWKLSGPGADAVWAVYAAGWVVAVGSTFLISHSDLLGLRQAWLHARRIRYSPPPFTERGVYGRIRHPLMAGTARQRQETGDMETRTGTRPAGSAQAGGRTAVPARVGVFPLPGLLEQGQETACTLLAHAIEGLRHQEEHRPLPDDAHRRADRAVGRVVIQNPGPLHHGRLSLVDRLKASEFVKRSRIGWTGGRAAVAIRPAYPEDLAALGDFFAGLSPRTRYLRFFGPVTPSPALLRQLCGLAGTIDAVVAVRGGMIVGHAMAADRTDPRSARATDIGVVVADAWQGRGLGSALMRALVTRAEARGVALLEMDVLYGNRQVIDMITTHWPAARVEHSPDSISIRILLSHQQQQRGRRQQQQQHGSCGDPVPFTGQVVDRVPHAATVRAALP